MGDLWPVSRALLQQILEDRCTDRFVCECIWVRLGYIQKGDQWHADPPHPRNGLMRFPLALK